jgi:hypothetical protein
MRLALTDQSSILASHIPAYQRQSLSFPDPSRFPKRVTIRNIPLVDSVADLQVCNVAFLFNYDIFPASILHFAAEWQTNERTMRKGDVIVQQAALPPLRLSVKCIFAVRILAIERSAQRMSFQYGTLQGHPESGVSEFALTLIEHNLSVSIQTLSQPGLRLSRIVEPFFTLPYQQYCTNRALEHMVAAFIRANSAIVSPDYS